MCIVTMAARIEIIIGSMFSGKSTELIRRCNRYECVGQKTLLINHSLDTRCESNVVQTHSKQTSEAIKVSKLCDIPQQCIIEAQVIGIDEAQFFEDLESFIDSVETMDKVIIVAGLDGDFKRQKFGKILDIVPKADRITKLTAMCSHCKDGTPGIFSARIAQNEKSQISVGDSDKYIPVCRKHFFTLSNEYHT